MKKDKGIQRALQRKQPPVLPTNFAFRTLLRIEEEKRLRQQRIERRQFLTMLGTCALMLLSLVSAAVWFYGEALRQLFQKVMASLPDITGWSFYLPTVVALALLWKLDRLLKRKFSPTQPSPGNES